MADKIDAALLLFLGAGWSDKKVAEFFEEVRDNPVPDLLKRSRALKRAIAKVGPKRAGPKQRRDEAVEKALKAIRTAGPYSETEIIKVLAERAEADHFSTPPIPKGGIRVWLSQLSDAASPERMLRLVMDVRNELMHNPRPGWSIRDVK